MIQPTPRWPMVAIVSVFTLVLVLDALGFGHTGIVRISAERCSELGGTLEHSRSVAHGGLHCELPNGTVRHAEVGG